MWIDNLKLFSAKALGVVSSKRKRKNKNGHSPERTSASDCQSAENVSLGQQIPEEWGGGRREKAVVQVMSGAAKISGLRAGA